MKEINIQKLLKSIVDDPIGIMDMAILSCGMDKSLTTEDVGVLSKNAPLLTQVKREQIRSKLQQLLGSEKAGKGLRLCLEINALQYILGAECVHNGSKRELEAFLTLSHNIDVVKNLDYKEALLFMCFEETNAINALNYLEYDEEIKRIYSTNGKILEDMAFIGNKLELKKFIFKYGWDFYYYIDALSKQQRKVYDLNEYRILSRKYIIEEMKTYKEVLFKEDLAVSEEDLVEAGIVTKEDADEMRDMLVDIVHHTPRLNTKEQLLKKAKSLAKVPFAKSLRKIRWIK